MQQINVGKLTHELLTAGIPVHGCASDGRIDFKDEATDAQKTQAETIKSNHNPVWYVEERRKAYPPIADQLDMIYWDQINGTTKWEDLITGIKAKYPQT